MHLPKRDHVCQVDRGWSGLGQQHLKKDFVFDLRRDVGEQHEDQDG
jgi:hypothetical protein